MNNLLTNLFCETEPDFLALFFVIVMTVNRQGRIEIFKGFDHGVNGEFFSGSHAWVSFIL